jgi:hypothetical protein
LQHGVIELDIDGAIRGSIPGNFVAQRAIIANVGDADKNREEKGRKHEQPLEVKALAVAAGITITGNSGLGFIDKVGDALIIAAV